jgi:hypothetical protein
MHNAVKVATARIECAISLDAIDAPLSGRQVKSTFGTAIALTRA